MPKKLTMVGVLMALVLGAFGLAGRSASANTPVQSFCTHVGGPVDPGQCPAAQVEANDWFQCYENGVGTPTAPVLSGSTVVCGSGTSDTAIPVGTGSPIKIWQIIRTPPGSRLTLPTTYSPPAWTYSSPAAGTAVGDVTAATDILCNGGTADILSTTGGSPALWPASPPFTPYSSIRQNLPPVDPDATTLSNNAYINDTRPFPATFTDASLDRANLTTLWLNGFTALEISPKLSEATNASEIANAGSPLATLVATSPYGTNPKVSVALLGGAASPATNDYLCLQSPQHSVALYTTVIPPALAGWYPRWTLMTSDRDFVDGQRTRILDVQCIMVGAPGADTDGDCLEDSLEAGAGTTVGVADTDGDTLIDGVEVAAGMNPLAGDADADGANDYTEMFQYSNPAVADTDGDGSLDKQDDLAGFNCIAVTGVCTVVNLGDTTADDNCPADANASQLNTDSEPDWTNTPNTPAGVFYRGDATNPHQDPQGDACDDDDDNDGLGDILEVPNGFGILNTFVAGGTWCKSATYAAAPITLVTTSSTDSDTDDDGGLDGRECQAGSKPTDATAYPGRFPTAAQIGVTDDGDLLFPLAAETFYHTNAIITPVGAGGLLINDLEQPGSYGSPIPDGKWDGVAPHDVDSDGDFLNDGVEVKWYAIDPANFDTDADGCSDGREAADVNGDHKVNSSDGLGVAQHQPTGSLAPSPAYFTPATGVRRPELATYDINKDGNINSTDSLLVAKLTGNCANGVGAQTNTKPIIELAK